MMTQRREANSSCARSWQSSSERDSGVVMRTSGSRSRWRRRVDAEVSPVRLSTVMSASKADRGAWSASSMSRDTARRGVM